MFIAVLRIHDILVWILICGSMPLTNGSGSCSFRHWPSRCQQKTNKKKFFCLLLFEGTFPSFSKVKSQKTSQSSRNQGFSYYFCLVIEESGYGSIPLANWSGSGSRRPKNIRTRRIRIRTLVYKCILCFSSLRPIETDTPYTLLMVKTDIQSSELASHRYFWSRIGPELLSYVFQLA
jgi:hypothetical protein